MLAARSLAAVLVLPFNVLVTVPVLLLVAYPNTRPVWTWPLPFAAGGVVWSAGCLFLGLGMMARTIALFAARGRGTLAPWDPPRHLVVEGPYRHVRNPMLCGVMFNLTAVACVTGSVPIFAWLGIFVLANIVYVRLAEEPALARRFGSEYALYRDHVPAWWPRRSPWHPETD